MHAYSKSIRHALSTVCGEWQSVLFAASRHSWGAACETWVSRSNSGFCLLLSPQMYFIYLFIYFLQDSLNFIFIKKENSLAACVL